MKTIQGNNVILALMKDDWVTLLCASDITLSLNLDTLENKTIGDGHWASFAHEKLSYSIAVSGLAILNDTDDQTNFSAFDSANHWIKSLYVQFRISYYDDIGEIKSFQGYALVSGLTFNMSTGNLVKDDCTLTGTGELLFFDGLVPCASLILTITVTGQTAADGIVHITYTYSGAPYQVKYRIDGTGSWIYSLVGTTIDVPDLANGSHSVEMIPVCANGYEGDHSTSQSFIVTHALTCSAVFNDITFTATSAAPVTSSGTPTQYKWQIDGGMFTTVAIGSFVSIIGQSVGTHSMHMIPICSNGVEGTGFTKSFVVATQPAQSIIDYAFSSIRGGNVLQIYVNGILVISPAIGASGFITVATGDSVRAVLQGINNSGDHMNLLVNNVTLSTTLSNQTGTIPNTFQYIWTANGDEYGINATVTP